MGTKLNYYHKSHAGLSVGSIGIDIGSILFVDSLFDYGTMEDKFITDISAGITVKNIAAQYLWEAEGVDLSATQTDDFAKIYGLGTSCRSFDRNLLVAVDIEMIAANYPDSSTKNSEANNSGKRVSSSDVLLQLGGEYSFDDKYFLRAGLNDGVITAGGGFRYLLDDVALIINYTFSDDRVGEGDDHIITFDINF